VEWSASRFISICFHEVFNSVWDYALKYDANFGRANLSAHICWRAVSKKSVWKFPVALAAALLSTGLVTP
jgi:hypothetical protein